jgi:NAD(P)-dependent dehydrogenase (short-subunit alcohol dehydrogenase family)
VPNLDWGLEGKSVIVTGASSGIGASISRALGSAGASVVLVGRNHERLEAVLKEVEERGGRTAAVYADLEEREAPAQIVREAVEAFGPIDGGIVHCASLFEPMLLADSTFESFDRQWRVNVAAPFLMTQAAVEHLQPGSSMVFLASTIALVGFPMCSAYTATKGATAAMGRAFAIELADRGIRVNTVCPGYVYTPMLQPSLDAFPGYEESIISKTPLGRIAGPDEIATTVLFLLSGLSTYVDGATLVADGGWVAQ